MPRETIASVKAEHALVVDNLTADLNAALDRLAEVEGRINNTIRESMEVKKQHLEKVERLRYIERHNALLTGYLLAKVPVDDIPIDVYSPSPTGFVT